jgi:hypothetical protein
VHCSEVSLGKTRSVGSETRVDSAFYPVQILIWNWGHWDLGGSAPAPAPPASTALIKPGSMDLLPEDLGVYKQVKIWPKRYGRLADWTLVLRLASALISEAEGNF